MRSACHIVADVLQRLKEKVVPGSDTLSLDMFAEKEATRRGARPAFKGYNGFPFSLCCSLNDQVVHGMPNRKPLADGDILSIDFGVFYNGFYGDAAITIPVGTITPQADKLIRVTRNSLEAAISVAGAGSRLSDISHAVQSFVEVEGFSVVRDFVGHGIGKQLHESPQVPNYGSPGKGIRLRPGMVLAIEPMINEKGHAVRILEDGWTAVTCDGGLSAHFEHTVAITENGPDVLTRI